MMTCIESEIIGNIVSQLRATEFFAYVSDNEIVADSAVPAAAVISRSWSDVSSEGLSGRFEKLYSMSIDIIISTRVSSSGQGNARLLELANGAADALLVDPTRGGLCCNLPEGQKATTIKGLEINENSQGNRRELVMSVACHYRRGVSESFSGPAIDGATLFSSGPSEIVFGSWDREKQLRGLAGLNGELSLDMGRRGREITQRGILSADTAETLSGLISFIEAKSDGLEHELTDTDGVTYTNVLLDNFEQVGGIVDCGVKRCEYEIKYRQLR